MKIYKISQVEYHDEALDFYRGQANNRLKAFKNEKVVGWIDYSVFNDEIFINHIKVLEKRKGIGSNLLKKLQELYPENELQMGGMTEEGHELWKSLEKRTVENEEYAKLIKEKEELERRLKQLENTIGNVPSYDGQTNREKELIIEHGEKMNIINDRLYEIDEEISDMKPSETFLI